MLSFERNVYGEIFVKQINENIEKIVPGCKYFDESIFVKYYNESGTKYNYGIKITSGNKTTHCMLYKEDYEKDLLINDAVEYMIELNNFSDNGNGKYAAAFGHDDMVMASVQLEFVKSTLHEILITLFGVCGLAPKMDYYYYLSYINSVCPWYFDKITGLDNIVPQLNDFSKDVRLGKSLKSFFQE